MLGRVPSKVAMVITHFDLRVREPQRWRWFSSAILRLAGVGLPIDFRQRRQFEMVSPFGKCL